MPTATITALAVALLLGAGPTQAGPRDGHDHDAKARHSFSDVEHWVEVFDDPARDSWQRPDEVLRILGVAPGQVIADLGAGTGYFTVRLARAVGDSGRVYAVDVEPALIEHLRHRAAAENLPQVVAVLAPRDDPALPPGGVDLVVVVDTWHHIDDRLEYLQKLAATLKPGGRVAVIDFREGELPVGPPPGHKLAREAVIQEFGEAGWKLSSQSDELPYQYLLVFRPPAS